MPIPLTVKIFKGEQLVATREFDRDLIKIGRLANAHLCLDDEKVSRIHSVLEVGSDGAIYVTDMSSVDGTYVNGKRVTKASVKFGDEIRVGNTRLLLEARDSGAGPVPAPESAAVQVSPALVEQNAAAVTAQVPMPASGLSPVPVSGPAPVPTSRDAAATAAARLAVAAAPSVPAPALPSTPKGLHPPPDASSAPTDKVGVAPRAVVADAKPSPRRAPAAAGRLGLEIRFYWGDQLLGVGHYTEPRNVLVGAGRTDFAIAPENLGGRAQFAVARPAGKDFAFCFADGMQGELNKNGQATALAELRRSAQPTGDGSYAHPLRPDEFAWVSLGQVRAEFAYAASPKPAFVPVSERMDYPFLNLLLLLMVVVGSFVITAINFPYDTDTMADDLFKSQARITKLILKAPEQQKKNPLLEKMAKELKRESPGEMAEKHKGKEGKMGKKDAPARPTRSAPRAIDINAKELVKTTGLVNMFGGGGGGISTIFGSGGLGGDLKGAIGNMFGAAVGDARGFGGLGLKGTGGGGGGTGMTIGIGSIGTKGRGGGLGGYGTGVGGFGPKKSVDVGISSTDAVVMGSLDKELIRQVIHRHRSEIRYCYEKELVSTPNLAGKVSVKFIITASGSVSTAKVDSSSMNNSAVEQCVTVRVRSWEFPKPKGGGIVVVTYPFVFKASGD